MVWWTSTSSITVHKFYVVALLYNSCLTFFILFSTPLYLEQMWSVIHESLAIFVSRQMAMAGVPPAQGHDLTPLANWTKQEESAFCLRGRLHICGCTSTNQVQCCENIVSMHAKPMPLLPDAGHSRRITMCRPVITEFLSAR